MKTDATHLNNASNSHQYSDFEQWHNSMRWYDAIRHCQHRGLAYVLVTIVKVTGSAPRDIQAKMVVTATETYDTIGGGGLEFDVIKTACDLLTTTSDLATTNITKSSNTTKSPNTTNQTDDKQAVPKNQHKSVMTKHYPLGAKLGQCCGGSVTVMFEPFNVIPPLSLLVFGAGHVAQALISVLSQLNCQVKWIDNRQSIIDEVTGSMALPAHINTQVSDDPTEFIKPYTTPKYVLVMTHDHSLDFEIIKTAIEVNKQPNILSPSNNLALSSPYIGCIGSDTKANRFTQRLSQRGFKQTDLDNLFMPIGLPIGGKEPMSVAVSIMAQVLQHYHGNDK